MKKFFLVFLLICLIISCEAFKKGEKGKHKKKKEASFKSSGDLKIEVEHRPDECTRKTVDGDTVSVHYTGMLSDGTTFDSSIPRGQPISFRLGSGMVIQGWEKGLLGMCVGEKRKLTIPPHLGYGENGMPPVIPPSATLIFTTELVKIE